MYFEKWNFKCTSLFLFYLFSTYSGYPLLILGIGFMRLPSKSICLNATEYALLESKYVKFYLIHKNYDVE